LHNNVGWYTNDAQVVEKKTDLIFHTHRLAWLVMSMITRPQLYSLTPTFNSRSLGSQVPMSLVTMFEFE